MSRLAAESKEHKEAIDTFKKAKQELDKLPVPQISPALHWTLFGLITVAEVAFNGVVFRVLGQTQFHTWVMAIGLMVVLTIVIPDFIERKLRMENKSKTTIALVVIGALADLLALFVIALLREKFLEANNIVEILGIEWEADSIIITFFAVNIALFVGTIVLGYEAGHKNPIEYKKAKKHLKRRKKA